MTSILLKFQQNGGLKSILQDSLFQNASYLFFTTVVNSIGGFVFWTLTARSVAPDQVGIASSTISTIVFVANVSGFGLGFGYIRFLRESPASKQLFYFLVLLTTGLSLVAGATFLVLMPALSPGLYQHITGFWIRLDVLLLVIALANSNLLLNFFIAQRAAGFGFIQIVLFNFIRIVSLLLMEMATSKEIVTITTVAFIIANITTFLVFVPRFRDENTSGKHPNQNLIIQILSYSFANHIASLFIDLPIMLFPLLVLEILGESSSAYIYMAWTISLFISAPGIALASSALTESCHTPARTREILLRSLAYSISVTVPMALMIGIGAHLFLSIFGQDYIENATSLLRILAITAPIVGINGILYSYLRSKSMHAELISISFSVSVMAFLLASAMMRSIGIVASGYGYFLSQILGLFLAILLIRKRLLNIQETFNK